MRSLFCIFFYFIEDISSIFSSTYPGEYQSQHFGFAFEAYYHQHPGRTTQIFSVVMTLMYLCVLV